jgi:hypothetical protein
MTLKDGSKSGQPEVFEGSRGLAPVPLAPDQAVPLAQPGNSPSQRSGAESTLKTTDFKVNEAAPRFKVTISQIIFITDDFIVFLDTNRDTYWWCTERYGKALPSTIAPILNRVAELEAIPIDSLPHERRLAFRTLVAEGVARALEQRDPASAVAAHDRAEAYVKDRLKEVTRSWYLTVAILGLCISGLLMALLQCAGVAGWIGRPATDFSVQLLAGCLGSGFSIITRVGGLQLDPAAGRSLHLKEAFARLLAGIVGALVVRLAISSGQILPVFANANSATLVLLCLVSGVSERLLPNLISKIDGKVDATDNRPPDRPKPRSDNSSPDRSAAEKKPGPSPA